MHHASCVSNTSFTFDGVKAQIPKQMTRGEEGVYNSRCP